MRASPVCTVKRLSFKNSTCLDNLQRKPTTPRDHTSCSLGRRIINKTDKSDHAHTQHTRHLPTHPQPAHVTATPTLGLAQVPTQSHNRNDDILK